MLVNLLLAADGSVAINVLVSLVLAADGSVDILMLEAAAKTLARACARVDSRART